MFRHSLWHKVLLPRSLLKIVPSTVPIFCLYLKHALEPDVEHGVPVVQQVDVEEAVGLPDGLFVDGFEVALRQQRRELFQQAVLFQLVPQAPDHEELGVHPDGVAYKAQLLGADPGGDLEVPAPYKERVQGRVAGLLVQVRAVGEVVYENQDLVELLHLELLAGLGDLALLADDLPQRRLVPVLEVDLLPVRGDFHGLLDVLLHGAPAIIDVDARAEDVDALKAAPVLLQNHADQGHRFARLAWSEQNSGRRQFGHHWVAWLLAPVVGSREDLDLAHTLPTVRRRGGRERI